MYCITLRPVTRNPGYEVMRALWSRMCFDFMGSLQETGQSRSIPCDVRDQRRRVSAGVLVLGYLHFGSGDDQLVQVVPEGVWEVQWRGLSASAGGPPQVVTIPFPPTTFGGRHQGLLGWNLVRVNGLEMTMPMASCRLNDIKTPCRWSRHLGGAGSDYLRIDVFDSLHKSIHPSNFCRPVVAIWGKRPRGQGAHILPGAILIFVSQAMKPQ